MKKPIEAETPKIQVNIYRVLEECVTTGVKSGLYRAFKHHDEPKGWEKHIDRVEDSIINAVLSDICEYFNWPDFYEK